MGGVELLGGLLILLGLLTRPAALALDFDLHVAITSTKIPMLLGHGFYGFAAPAIGNSGFWAMTHESRTELSMLLRALFLLWVGAGRISFDASMRRRMGHPDQ